MAITSPSYQLADGQWEQIRDLLPSNGQRGGQWKDHRLLIDGILWVLSDGGRWRNLPERFGPWQTVYDRFRKWCRTGLCDRFEVVYHESPRPTGRGLLHWNQRYHAV